MGRVAETAGGFDRGGFHTMQETTLRRDRGLPRQRQRQRQRQRAKMTPEDSPCIDAKELHAAVASNKTIALYRHSMGMADALVAPIACRVGHGYVGPNPLFAKLRSTMQRVQECTSHFAQHALLNNSMAWQKRLLSKTEYFDSMTQMSASLDTELGELEGLCKRLSNMQEQCTKKT